MSIQFHNRSSDQLADEYGNLKAQQDALGEQLTTIKDELIKRGDERIEGQRFTLTISQQTSMRLDTKALKAALGDDICAEYEKPSTSTVVRVKATAIFGQAA